MFDADDPNNFEVPTNTQHEYNLRNQNKTESIDYTNANLKDPDSTVNSDKAENDGSKSKVEAEDSKMSKCQRTEESSRQPDKKVVENQTHSLKKSAKESPIPSFAAVVANSPKNTDKNRDQKLLTSTLKWPEPRTQCYITFDGFFMNACNELECFSLTGISYRM